MPVGLPGGTLLFSMLTATPAGATDMALISADIGLFNPDIILMQVFRSVIAISVFPQIMRLVAYIFS